MLKSFYMELVGLCDLVSVPDTCYHKDDFGLSYHGQVNFALPSRFVVSNGCRRWDDRAWFELETHPELDYVQKSTYCANLRTLMHEPYCHTKTSMQACGIPQCGKKRQVAVLQQ